MNQGGFQNGAKLSQGQDLCSKPSFFAGPLSLSAYAELNIKILIYGERNEKIVL